VHIGARKSNSHSLKGSSFLDKVAFNRTVVFRICRGLSHYVLGFQCSNCGSSVLVHSLRFTAVNFHSSVGIISELQTCTEFYGSESASFVLLKRIGRKDGSGEREHPGGAVLPACPMENDRGLQSSLR
jgi:hypothetical protein